MRGDVDPRHFFQRCQRGGRAYARMLYDHRTDPKENVNVSERPENAALVRRLRAMLGAGWREARPGS